MKQTIDGQPPIAESHLADENSHPINWDIDPNQTTLYAVAMSGNQLFRYDLTSTGDTLEGHSLGKLIPTAESTDCPRVVRLPHRSGLGRASAAQLHKQRHFAQLVSYKPGSDAPTDHGPLAVRNTDFTTFADGKGTPFPWHQGFRRFGDGNMIPSTVPLGVCATRDAQYVLALAPFTLLEARVRSRVPSPVERKPVAGITTVYRPQFA